MKPPVILYEVGSLPVAVMCGECRMSVWRLDTFGAGPGSLDAATEAADHCCHPRPCPTCGEALKRGSWCHPCRVKADADRVQRDFETATKVLLGDYSEAYVFDGVDYIDANDVEEHMADGDLKPIVAADGTRFLWGTEPEKPRVDLERECSEDWLQEHHEDAIEQVDMAKIREAQKLVDEALAGVTSYYEDRSVAVILVPADDESSP